MATVVFQPDEDRPDISDANLIVTNNGDIFNETASTMVTSTLTQGTRNSAESREKPEECREFIPREKAACVGGACASSFVHFDCNDGASTSANKIARDKSSIFKLSNDFEPLNFTEEIQKLLKGEELKFADDTDSLADFG